MGLWDKIEKLGESIGSEVEKVKKDVSKNIPDIIDRSLDGVNKLVDETAKSGSKAIESIKKIKYKKSIKKAKKHIQYTMDDVIDYASDQIDNSANQGKKILGKTVKTGSEIFSDITENKNVKKVVSQIGEAGSDVFNFSYKWGSKGIQFSYDTFFNALSSSTAITPRIAAEINEQIKMSYRNAKDNRKKIIDNSAIMINAVLASDFSQEIESWLGNTFNEGIPSVYDKAVDAVYNASHIGGSKLHRLFDESHTVWDMWDKVQNALPNDRFLQEVLGYTTALGKDLSSTMGIPLANMTPENYDKIADSLQSSLHIPRDWIADAMHLNANELVGGSIGAIAVALNWNKAEVKQFSRMAGSLGISTMASANPALAAVSLTVLAKGFMEAKETGDYTEYTDGLIKGGVGTGVFIGTVSVVGGPAWIGVLSAFALSSAVKVAMDEYSSSEIGEYLDDSMHRLCSNI